MDCSKIAANLVAANCAKAELGGTGALIYLMNYEDIDRVASTVTENVISAIVMKGSTLAYTFESLEDSHVGEFALVAGTYYNEYDHTLNLRVFTKSEPAKAFMNSAKNARLVAVVPHKAIGTAGEVKWEAYGWDAGLKATEETGTTEMTDKVVYNLKLASSDNAKEQSLPKSVFITSLTLTETMLSTLLT